MAFFKSLIKGVGKVAGSVLGLGGGGGKVDTSGLEKLEVAKLKASEEARLRQEFLDKERLERERLEKTERDKKDSDFKKYALLGGGALALLLILKK